MKIKFDCETIVDYHIPGKGCMATDVPLQVAAQALADSPQFGKAEILVTYNVAGEKPISATIQAERDQNADDLAQMIRDVLEDNWYLSRGKTPPLRLPFKTANDVRSIRRKNL